MSQILGTVRITGPISPIDTNDTYPVTNPSYGLGGLRTVALSSDLASIPTARKEVGMVAYVEELSAHYKLTEDLSTWDIFGGSNYNPTYATTSNSGVVFQADNNELTGIITVDDKFITPLQLNNYGVGILSAGLNSTISGGIYDASNLYTTSQINGLSAIYSVPATSGAMNIALSSYYAGGLTWQSVSANTLAINNNGYMVDLTSNNVTLSAPSTPLEEGYQFGVRALTNGTTNKLTLSRNGSKFENTSGQDMVFDVDDSGGIFVYNTLYGWSLVTEIANGITPVYSYATTTSAGIVQLATTLLSNDTTNVITPSVLYSNGANFLSGQMNAALSGGYGNAYSYATTSLTGVVQLATTLLSSDTTNVITPSLLISNGAQALSSSMNALLSANYGGGGGGGGGAEAYGYMWLDAGVDFYPRATNGAVISTSESLSNFVNTETLDFTKSYNTYIQSKKALPPNCDFSNIKTKIYWTANATSGSVVFGVQGQNFVDGIIDSAYGSPITVTNSCVGTGKINITPAITITGLSGGISDRITSFQVYRDTANGADTLSANVKLLGMQVQYGKTTLTPW